MTVIGSIKTNVAANTALLNLENTITTLSEHPKRNLDRPCRQQREGQRLLFLDCVPFFAATAALLETSLTH